MCDEQTGKKKTNKNLTGQKTFKGLSYERTN